MCYIYMTCSSHETSTLPLLIFTERTFLITDRFLSFIQHDIAYSIIIFT